MLRPADIAGIGDFQIDSTKPVQVTTQFITDDCSDHGKLVKVEKLYTQDGMCDQLMHLPQASNLARADATLCFCKGSFESLLLHVCLSLRAVTTALNGTSVKLEATQLPPHCTPVSVGHFLSLQKRCSVIDLNVIIFAI